MLTGIALILKINIFIFLYISPAISLIILLIKLYSLLQYSNGFTIKRHPLFIYIFYKPDDIINRWDVSYKDFKNESLHLKSSIIDEHLKTEKMLIIPLFNILGLYAIMVIYSYGFFRNIFCKIEKQLEQQHQKNKLKREI